MPVESKKQSLRQLPDALAKSPAFSQGNPIGGDALTRKRRLVADLCQALLAYQIEGKPAPDLSTPLPPRERQTLEHLLTGCAEKEIAQRLDISRHTVHIYVKSLYRRFQVSSRGELLAKWVRKP